MLRHNLDLMAFMAQPWLIEREAGTMLLAQLVSGNGVLALEIDEDPIHYADPNWIYYPAAQKEGSTVILNITGVIYDYYVNYLCAKLDMIYADPNAARLIVRINGPGGAANAGNKLADKIQASPIPTFAFIDYGMAASAHYMVACACDAIYASRPNDRAGSIGTLISYQDWSKYFDKMGIVTKELYAKQSTQKNEEFRQAADGNFKLLQQAADSEAQRFIDYVLARRPGINEAALKGRLFNGTDSLENGLIDGIADLKSAFKSFSTTTSNTTPRTTMLGYVKLSALAAVKGTAAADLSDAQLEAINTELNAAYPGLAIVSQSQLDAAVENANKGAGDATALATATAEVTRLTNELTTANNKVSTLTTERNEFKEKAEEYGAMNAAEKTQVQKKNEVQADSGEQSDSDKTIANLAHNKSLEGSWLWDNVAASQTK
ncbi:S49 family peptidase [Spirosoma oryzicola]|uniref:S49 family peptidase n=1 Tax=Spirosoma oryzicola TaxID=2898794 RepID=UPI001E54112E|nr:S49 family peptidase [Spirosoma oryzicola]UHG93449.1 S49 family peptidase [Spirosoma oryzicola]